MSPAQNARTFAFGDDNSLTAAITDPPHPHRASQVAVILWGMGVAEMRAARALAKLGLVAMQIRQNGDYPNMILDKAGVRRCKEAMELLRSKRAAEKFILMGNCGVGSVSFNAALADPRVIGLIITNPHVSEVLSLGASYKRKLLSWESWWHVLTGKATIAHHFANIRWLKEYVLGWLKRADEKSLIEKVTYNQDLTLPADVGGRLKSLAFRGVKTLMIFSQDDISLDYFQQLFGKSLAELRDLPNVRVEVLNRKAHVISHDDEAARMTADIIADWAKRTVARAAQQARRVDIDSEDDPSGTYRIPA